MKADRVGVDVAPRSARRGGRGSGFGVPRARHGEGDPRSERGDMPRDWRRQSSATAEDLTIDLAVEPATLDPALVYESDGWSVVHSIYDALVQLGPDGALEMVLAESMTQVDPLTWEIRLRPGHHLSQRRAA